MQIAIIGADERTPALKRCLMESGIGNNGAEYPATDAESDYCITVAGIGGGWQNQRKQGKNRNGIILCSGEKCYLWRLFPGGSDTKTIRAADTAG